MPGSTEPYTVRLGLGLGTRDERLGTGDERLGTGTGDWGRSGILSNGILSNGHVICREGGWGLRIERTVRGGFNAF